MADVLVVDDDPSIARAFERFLALEGHQCRIASTAEEGLGLLEARLPDLVLLDVRMPGMDGIAALERIRSQFPDADVIIMTAFSSGQTSIDAMRAGAFDLLLKPLSVDALRSVIARVVAARQVRERLVSHPGPAGDADEALVGGTPGMLQVFKMIGRLATVDVPALVVGERGTGRRTVVSAIHRNSARRDEPVRLVDCAGPTTSAWLDDLLAGVVGTWHLANLEALTAHDQARITDWLGAQPGPRTSRIIASTTVPARSLAGRSGFSAELLGQVAVVTIDLPPLRDRRDDLAPLVDVLLTRLGREIARPIRGVDREVMRQFHEYSWPGNVTELWNALRRAAVLASTDVLTMADFGDSFSRPVVLAGAGEGALEAAARASLHVQLSRMADGASAYHEIVTRVEEALVDEALAMTQGNQVRAAELLGVNRTTLRKRAGRGARSGNDD